MGTLKTTITLEDKFSNQLNKINKSIQTTANNINRLNNLNVNSVKSVNNALNQQITQNNTIMKQLGRMATKFRNIASVVFGVKAGIMGINNILKLSDRMTMNTARLSLMADENNPVEALEAKSFAAAMRSRSDYLDFNKAVTKLGILAGDKFANQDSIIRFTELMQKQFAVGGADASERSAAMLQLTQAIASNRLQGDELRSLRENAPLLVKAIQDSLGVSEAKFKDMAKAGEITADVIIKAMANSASEVEEMFNKLPLTWEHVWTRMKNVGYLAFKPIQQQLSRLFNNQQFLKFIVSIQNAMIVLGNVAGWALKTTLDLVGWLIEQFNKYKNVLLPILYIMIALDVAALAYYATVGLINVLTKAWTALTTALTAVRNAQFLLNLVMSMNPIALVVEAVVFLIFVFYGVIAAINHFCGTSISATGIIAGVFAWLGATIFNIFAGLWNAVISMVDFVVNIFISVWETALNAVGGGFDNFGFAVANIISQIISWFMQLGKIVTTIIDAIFGTNWTKGLNSLQESVIKWGKNDKAIKLERNVVAGAASIKRTSTTDWYDKGYNWGSNLSSKISNIDLNISKAQLEALNGINNGVGDMSEQLGNVAGNTGDTAKNTGKTADNTSSGYEQDYSYLRNWAYRAGMGGSIGYEIKIEQNNRNSIASYLDAKKISKMILDELVDGLNGQAEVAR